jgi:hypothetical protein
MPVPLTRPWIFVTPNDGQRNKGKAARDPHNEHHVLVPGTTNFPAPNSKRDSTAAKSGATYFNVTIVLLPAAAAACHSLQAAASHFPV